MSKTRGFAVKTHLGDNNVTLCMYPWLNITESRNRRRDGRDYEDERPNHYSAC